MKMRENLKPVRRYLKIVCVLSLKRKRSMGGGTGGYRGYMYPPPFLEGGYKRVHSVKVCVYPVVR